MKVTATTLILLILFSVHTYAQDSPQWHLPEGAKARFGKGAIFEIAYSPDGTRLAVAGGVGIWIYDMETYQEVDLLTGHTRRVTSVAFSPDGTTLASGGGWGDSTVRLWDVATGTNTHTLTGHTEWVESVSFSPDGNTIASGSWDSTVRLWDVATGAHKSTLIGHTGGVSSVTFSPDGNKIASASRDSTVRLWDVATGALINTFTEHTDLAASVSFSPDGNTIASGSYDTTVRLWNVATGTNIRTLTGHTGQVTSVAFSPDGTTLASGGGWDRTVKIWDAQTGTPMRTLTGHTAEVSSVSFSPDGNTLASTSSWGETVRLWEVGTGSLIHILTGHTFIVDSISLSPDGNTIASGSRNGTIRLWNVGTGVLIHTLTGGYVYSVAFSPDGNTIASGSGDATVRLWDVDTGTNTRTLTGHEGGVTSVAFSPDGNTLASGSHDNTVRLWDVDTGTNTRTLTGHEGGVTSVSFSPDGNTLASGGLRSDPTVRLWDVATGTLLHTLGHEGEVRSVSFSPDGNILASASLDIHLWDVTTGAEIRPRAGDRFHSSNAVSFSPDGNTLAGEDGAVLLFDVATDTVIHTLTGHTSFVTSVSFHPDGNALASGSGDGTVLLWELAPAVKPPPPAEEPLPLEYLWSIPADISLIHVPLKVTAVDGVAKTITSIADLYDALGGADTVNFLITLDPATQQWLGYFSAADKGTAADRTLTDAMGIVAGMKAPVSIGLSGDALGTNGSSTITLAQNFNLIGLPLRDSRITVVSDLLTLPGMSGNVHTIILSDSGEFKVVARAGDAGDIPVTAGQAFILIAGEAATVSTSGQGWHNGSGVAAAPTVSLPGIQTEVTTPVLALRGSVVAEAGGLNRAGFRVTAKNLSTGRVVTGITEAEGGSYQLIVVDMQTTRAAQIGDILEITAQSVDRSIEVEPLRYTVTAADVKQSQILLETLIAYEIPTETALLRNYPNPFNPETWIPYHLADAADVHITIYDIKGAVVRQLDLGHQQAGYYADRSKAAYWDGRNKSGELVASGIYFYTLKAKDFSATKRMVIVK